MPLGTTTSPGVSLVDRSAEFGTPPTTGPPTACVIPGLGIHNIAYRDTSGRLHELWRDAQGATGTTNLTANAPAGTPTAAGNPFAYVDTSRNTEILLFRSSGGTVRSLYWSTGSVGHDNISGTATGAPSAASDPVGYYVAAADTHHVIYRTGDGHLHELNWTGLAPAAYGGNLTRAISAPTARGVPSAFANAAGLNIVVYRSGNGEILGLYWADGPSGLDRLSSVAGTPPATGDPVAYYTAHDDTHQVVYRAGNGHLYELYWPGVAPVLGWDLTPSGAPAATGTPAAYYSAGTNTKHVIYRSADGGLHEIWWVPGGTTPAHVDLTAWASPAADRPAAFTVEGRNTHHVTYRGTNNHIHELRRWTIVSFNATTLNFGTQLVGTPAPSQTFSITNTNSMLLRVAIAPLSASGFRCEGFTGTLDRGASQGITISFTPPRRGLQLANLSITTSAANSPHTINLMGAGGWRWLAPINVSIAGQNAVDPQVAVDARGTAVAVWSRFNGTRYIVQGALRPAGGAWQAPIALSAASQEAAMPQVAVDARGTAVAVWRTFNGTRYLVQGAVRPAGGAWQAPITVSGPGQDAVDPQVAVNAQGSAVAVWRTFNGTHNVVQGAMRPADGSWQAPITLSAPGQDAVDPQVAVNAQGSAVAVWSRSNGTHDIVQGAVRPAGEAWQAPTDLSAAGQDAGNPQVAVNAQGTTVAVWSRSNGTHDIVQGAVRLARRAWQAPINLSAAGQSAVDPQVAIDAQGTAVAVWQRSNGTHDIVQGAVHPASWVWSTPITLSAAGQHAQMPQVAIDAQGNAVAVWRRFNGTHYIVQSAAAV
ncbi:MAG: hypothetical protein ACRDTH_06545 [Pseudonocardiaceae bacterium]